MHSVSCFFFAIVGDNQMMVLNKDTKEIMAKCSVNDDIIYWTWVNAQVIALITEASVFHWTPYNGKITYQFL